MADLATRLGSIRDQGLLRRLRKLDSSQGTNLKLNNQRYLNFSSNDYLGLASHPLVNEAAIRAIERFGAGCGASRLVCGSLAIHHELEEALAHFKKAEAALSFSSGYSAAIGTIAAIVGKDDVVILDKLVHASIIDGARLSGAKLRIFRHNDVSDLEKILRQENRKNSASKKLIVTESVFSMDGDRSPLNDIVAAKEKHGAWLMLDEAHAAGVIGAERRGLAELEGVSRQIEIQMGTLGKALGSAGGYICGSRTLIDCLINKARSFIFSTAPVPAAAGAAIAALSIVGSKDGKTRCEKLWNNISALCARLGKRLAESAIVPVIIGDEAAALKLAEELLKSGLYVPAIRYPTVARGSARLRVTLSAAHTDVEIAALAQALQTLCPVRTDR